MWTAGRSYPKLNSENTKGRFDGYVVLVAGGCSGIGYAAVERFANDGATVYALDIKTESKTELEEKFGDRVTCINLDITDADKCQQVAADIATSHGMAIHTLVNTAAYFGSKGINATKEDWERSFEVNVAGYSNMVQAVLPYMQTGQGCSVVNLSSISAHRAQPDRWTYSATKGAISIMSKCMALDLGTKDIRVNAVSPSWIWTPAVAAAANNERSNGERLWKDFFICGRLGEVEEVAAVITFLASKDASYVTGADIPVCGGYLAIGPEQLGANSKFAPPLD